MHTIIYQTHPHVTFASNLFINVSIILQYDITPLISIVREPELGFTTQIPIYHADGTYLAQVTGTRVSPTKAGRKAGIEMRSLHDMTVCDMGGKTLFELHHRKGDAFQAHTELYTPSGCLIKSATAPIPGVIKSNGEALQIDSLVRGQDTFIGSRIGVWLKSDGSLDLGSR